MNDKTTPPVHNGHILGLTAVLFVPIGVFLSKGVAPLFAVAAVSCLVLGLWRHRAVALIPGPVAYALAVLALWALVSWFWSIMPGLRRPFCSRSFSSVLPLTALRLF